MVIRVIRVYQSPEQLKVHIPVCVNGDRRHSLTTPRWHYPHPMNTHNEEPTSRSSAPKICLYLIKLELLTLKL